MRKSIFAAALLATLPFSMSVSAAEQGPAAARAPAALNAPIQAGFTVEKSFPAVSGLTGWVLKGQDGQYSVFFTTADGQSLMAGALITANGENLTQKYTESQVPKPDLAKLWDGFEKSSYVATGTLKNPKNVIYAVIDPNCVFCHYLYLALLPYEKVGLQVRWVPVAILREDSATKSAQILEEGAAALAEQQAKYNTPGMPKGIALTPALQAKLEANQALMREAQMNGTPGVLYKDAQGKVLKKDGMPSLADLPAITKLPEQPQTDERLNRFKQ